MAFKYGKLAKVPTIAAIKLPEVMEESAKKQKIAVIMAIKDREQKTPTNKPVVIKPIKKTK